MLGRSKITRSICLVLPLSTFFIKALASSGDDRNIDPIPSRFKRADVSLPNMFRETEYLWLIMFTVERLFKRSLIRHPWESADQYSKQGIFRNNGVIASPTCLGFCPYIGGYCNINSRSLRA